jgi:hypothetical protein
MSVDNQWRAPAATGLTYLGTWALLCGVVLVLVGCAGLAGLSDQAQWPQVAPGVRVVIGVVVITFSVVLRRTVEWVKSPPSDGR